MAGKCVTDESDEGRRKQEKVSYLSLCTYLEGSHIRPALVTAHTYIQIDASNDIFQIFQALEHPVEVETMEEIKELVLLERQNFVHFIFNGSWNSVVHRDRIDEKLLEYEQTVAVAANEGIDLSNKEPVYQWSYIQAVFFASTILTTIGE